MTDRPITKAYMDECFEYRDGNLIWRDRPLSHFIDEWRQKIFRSRQTGTVAGTLVSGYRVIRFSWGRISVHRIIFLMHNNYLPDEIDHIDGNPLNNRIENLREATHTQNQKNMRTPSSNTSGHKGVSFHKRAGKWVAGIRVGGYWKHLGVFATLSEAVAARKTAEAAHYGEFSNER